MVDLFLMKLKINIKNHVLHFLVKNIYYIKNFTFYSVLIPKKTINNQTKNGNKVYIIEF